MKKINYLLILGIAAAAAANTSCMNLNDEPSLPGFGIEQTAQGKHKIDFDVLVTREGKVVTRSGQGVTKSGSNDGVDGSQAVTLDPRLPFGLIGFDKARREVVINNQPVNQNYSGQFSGQFDSYFWNDSDNLHFSAYYPHVSKVSYADNLQSYSIPYSVKDTEAGPLVSKTVEKAISQLNMVPLVFQHITNDIGFKVCDATPVKELQGKIRLRKLTATNVASAGVYTNDLDGNGGSWDRQGYYRRQVVFEGNAPVGVGSENEKFVGHETLEDRMMDSHRYYSIPDQIELGKQCVEVVFDVDGFTHNGFYYEPLENQTATYMLYGLLENNEFEYGKQYTFHIGLDLSSVYHEITFAPSVAGWETKIYENNDTF